MPTLRARDCRCRTCRLFDCDSGTVALDRPIRCELCVQRLFETHKLSSIIVRYVPQEVTEILGVKNICWACRNYINAYVKLRFGLCWGTASFEALEVAITCMVRNALSAHVGKDTRFERWKRRNSQNFE